MSYLRGHVIKGYELHECIGEGGFGAVYRAYQPVVEREVAIKVILPEFTNQPDFIRHFEIEAQLIARLEHPYIVPLYDYWRDAGGAYLVMRVLRTSLRTALRKRVWSPQDAAQLLDQIASALMVAHRQGIVHRDIKPDNILLDEDNNAYLADFGIALNFEQASQGLQSDLAVGSLAYMAPEQFDSQRLTAQADLYSLGIVLYEVLAGTKPFPESLSITELIEKHRSAPLPSLALKRDDLPAALDKVLQKATSKNPADRYPDVLTFAEEFRHALIEKVQGTIPLSPKLENPYKGLRAFREADVADFFGREALTKRLIRRMQDSSDNFLAVIGPSGSGKSSVIHAGLLPALRRGMIPGSEDWFIASMRPGANPLVSLEAAILSIAVNPPPTLLAQLRGDVSGLAQALKQIAPLAESSTVLLVIDQFEEVFTLLDSDSERSHFLKSLHHAITTLDGKLKVIIGLRADFVERALRSPGLSDLIRFHAEFVIPHSVEELEQAIVLPAKRVGLQVETELIAAIFKDIGEQLGVLPLLEYSLTDLFEHQQDGKLTLAAYQESGGVLGALARHAEALYSGLNANQQMVARQLFLRLVRLGEGVEDTKRRIGRSEIASLATDKKVLDSVIDIFSDYRLLTLDHDPVTRSPTIEIAHEALIRSWQRLHTWLDESRDDLRIHRRLLSATRDWINAGHEPSLLTSGIRLDTFEALAQKATVILTTEEAEYLQASIAERNARQKLDQARKAKEIATARLVMNFQRATIGLAIAAVIAVIAIIVLAGQANNAVTQVTQANSMVSTAQAKEASIIQVVESLRLASESNRLLLAKNGNVETAALLSIRALNITYVPEADTALTQAMEQIFTLRVLRGSTSGIYSVAASQDGRYVASGCADGTAAIWDFATGQRLKVLSGHTGPINSVAFSPDSKYLLTGSKDESARLWDIASGRVVRTFAVRISPDYGPGPEASVNTVAFSPDGKYVLTGSRDRVAWIWDVASGRAIRSFSDVEQGIFGVAWSPNGKYVALAYTDQQVRIHNAETGDLVQTLVGHTAPIWNVAFSPDSQQVITGSNDTTVRIWDIATGKALFVLKGHTADINGVAFSPDGKYALSGSYDGTARLWDASTGELVRIFSGHTGPVWAVAFSPDGKSIMTGSDDQTVRIWNAEINSNLMIFAHQNATIWTVAFSHNGKYVLTGGDDHTAQIWDTKTSRPIQSITDKAAVYTAAFSPDDHYVLTGSGDNTPRLWDASTGKLIREFKSNLDQDPVYGVAFSADGKLILAGGNDAALRLWNVATGENIQTFTGHTGPISSVAFSPDGKYVLSGSSDHFAKLWDVATGQVIWTLTGHSDTINSVAFSPDGKYIVTGSNDSTAKLWDIANQKLVRTLVGHAGSVTSVAFSPDGTYILTASNDGTAKLWNAHSTENVRTFTGHSSAVNSAVFSPDGSLILTGSADTTIRLWQRDYPNFVAFACSKLSRDLNDGEKQRFAINDNTPTCPQFTVAITPTPTP